MQRTQPKLISEILEEVLKQNEMDRRLLEVQASEAWEYVVGAGIAAMTMKPWCRDGKMTVRIPSPALRNELSMHRTELIAALNKAVGHPEVVTDLRFTS